MRINGAEQLEVFRRYLRDRNLPVTSQREEVAKVVFFADDHLSVEDIERSLQHRAVHVGKATIYRTLDLMSTSGLIKEHNFGEGFKRYEPVTGQTRHEHLICQGCGKVMEFTNDRIERLVTLITEEQEFRPQYHRLEIYGHCRTCQRREADTLAADLRGLG